eukprot:11160353-Karenia_brevis.AAC.1
MVALWLLQSSSQNGTSPEPGLCSALPIQMCLRLMVGPAFYAPNTALPCSTIHCITWDVPTG